MLLTRHGRPVARLVPPEDGAEERVVDIICSDGRAADPTTGRCAATSATVDLSDCSISGEVGASELKALWTDPDYDSNQNAFYYARVIENPTCRWSTYDALRVGREPLDIVDPIIREMAWSSPIWIN